MTSSRRNSLDVKISPININSETSEKQCQPTDLCSTSLQPRNIDLKGGIVMIISLMIGSGIFTFPGKIHKHAGSTGLAMCIWLLSGVLALTGALCYAELGTMIPGSGGEAQYLSRGLGPLFTYLFDWTSILILKPGTVALMLLSFSEYAIQLIKTLTGSSHFNDGKTMELYVKTLSCIGCVGVTALSAYSHRWSNRILDALTWSKLIALGLIISGGFMFSLFSDPSIFEGNVLSSPFSRTQGQPEEAFDFAKFFGQLVLALCAGLWGFEGWNNLNIVSGDLKNPKRNLPLAIWISVGLVLGLYMATLLGYYCVIPADEFMTNETVGLIFGEKVVEAFIGAEYAWIGAVVLSIAIMGSTFSAALSSMVTSTEIVVLSANNGNIPSLFGEIDSKTKTAFNAYALQGALSVLLTIIFKDGLITLYTFPTWIFYTLCAVVLVQLRFVAPELERPYKVWITTPILFLLSCAILIVSLTYEETFRVVVSFAVILLGVPFYFWFTSGKDRSKEEAQAQQTD